MDSYSFKILTIDYIEIIIQLLKNNYIEDYNSSYRIFYSYEYIYSLLSQPNTLMLGLVSNNKLLGSICGSVNKILLQNNQSDVCTISLFCIQKKIRKMGFGKMLLNELKKHFANINKFFIHTINCIVTDNMQEIKEYFIPINHSKLKKIGFLNEDITYTKILNNPLHTLKENNNTKEFYHKIKNAMGNIYYDGSNCQTLLSKKNSNISFCILKNNVITDFISVHQTLFYCFSNQEILTVAIIDSYFHESLTLTDLIKYLIDKLVYYHFDQLIFYGEMDIDIEYFGSCDRHYIKMMDNKKN